MASTPAPDAEAAQRAFQQFATEAWTLLAVGLSVILLRTYSRIRSVGLKGLRADDFLVWLAGVLYAGETGLAYSVGFHAHGLANNGMTDSQRAGLSPDSDEFRLRIVGCKIQLAGWSSYSTLLWTLKASLLVFYMRLTAGLDRHYIVRIYVGFALLASTWLTVELNLLLACRPFYKYWQIFPDPGNVCQPAVSNQVIWVYFTFNVLTDLYLISIPVPMLWNATLRPLKKIGFLILFSGGLFIVACATLRCILIVTDPVNGAQLAGSWAVRETFVAVVTTNMPLVVPLLQHWAKLAAGSMPSIRSSRKSDKSKIIVRTFGGGQAQSWRGRGPPSANPIPDITFSESEERMVVRGDVHMQNISECSSA
ncbi:hypothetical protein JDV02_008157 [Purpureocillium takamizusanense]|uniref:Rhodopsin domain-containing protein n=1 Tax=Purpureocillium takamizusanense TaxID=2060973 RepID=A0A9Q8QPP0_9HYPO|nr:uncharacterized protein JDV02_008157 [Purpureocillium takamizusanense]UNI22252.1 hypothetical protein JDV02_008157 [Purpureocillium takamizusanense]